MEKIKTIAKLIGIGALAILYIILCFLDPKAGFLLLGAGGIWQIAQILDERLPKSPINVHVIHKMKVINEEEK